MGILSIIIALVLIGFFLYLVNVYVPMDATIKKILNVVVFIVVVLWLLQVFGILGSLRELRLR